MASPNRDRDRDPGAKPHLVQQQHVEAEEEEAGERDVPHPLVVLGREPALRELGAYEREDGEDGLDAVVGGRVLEVRGDARVVVLDADLDAVRVGRWGWGRGWGEG